MQEIGLNNGSLMPCNDRANCAITQMVDDQRPNVEPINYSCSRKTAYDLIKQIVLGLARTKIITQKPDYIHATFTSWFWHFVDDVEFYFPENESVIHMRSASRTGTYDLGVNKRRLKKIKKIFDQKSK